MTSDSFSLMLPPPVPRSEDFARIMSLPRRTWSDDEGEEMADLLTGQLLNTKGLAEWKRASESTDRDTILKSWAEKKIPLRLRWEQALMLVDFIEKKRLFGGAAVGVGKTLALWLMLVIADRNWGVTGTVIMLQASVLKQMIEDFRRYAWLWQAPRHAPRFLTYQRLSRAGNHKLLCDCKLCSGGDGTPPGLVLFDEFDCACGDSAVGKKVTRFITHHLDTPRVGVTGSPKEHIHGLSKAVTMILGLDAPVPIKYLDQKAWAEALDEKPRSIIRRPAGALIDFATPGDIERYGQLDAVRRGVQRRLAESPGVVLLDSSSCEEPLTIRVVEAPGDAALDAHFDRFRETDETPDGWPLSDVFSWLRHGVQAGCGFYHTWDPHPPLPWREALKAKNRFIADKIEETQNSTAPLFSDLEVERAFKGHPVFEAWYAIEDTFVPNSVPVPITTVVLRFAADLLIKNGPGIAWTQHTWVGQTLAKMLNIPFYGPGGKSEKGVHIDKHDYRYSAVASLHSSRRGRDGLQRHNYGLIVGPEWNYRQWEQWLGRHHRSGQYRPVTIDVIVACAEHVAAIEKALADSRAALSGMRKKVLTAEWDWSMTGEHVRKPNVLDNNHQSKARWMPRKSRRNSENEC